MTRSIIISNPPISQVPPLGCDVPKISKPPSIGWAFLRQSGPCLAGVKAQFDSEVVYGSIKSLLQKQGVIFLSMDEALKNHPDLVREYFGTVIPREIINFPP
jgi:Fe-S cluster assembly scaffold protein SufB